MYDSKTLNILLVEDDLEDEQLLAEALTEIEDNRQWCNWHSASVLQVEQLADALNCLREQRFDVVLLNLSLPDSPALLESFHRAKACARGAPIVVLADEADENFANLLLREGAQDVLLKSSLDCVPLARSVRYAIERQRRSQALGSSLLADPLTGVLGRAAFLAVAGRYVALSTVSRAALLLASLEVSGLADQAPEDRDQRDLVLMAAAGALRDTFPQPALIGRLGDRRFGLLTAGLAATTVQALLNRAALSIEDQARQGRHPVTARFSVAEIEPGANLEEMLGQDGDAFATRTRAAAKTVMLAD